MNAEKLFEKHWAKATGKPLDEVTKHYMKYAIDAIEEAFTISSAFHSPERENELQELCIQVLNANPDRYYNPNGADETTCPFCYAKDFSTGCMADIQDIKHDVNCAYNIAKGLSTNSR